MGRAGRYTLSVMAWVAAYAGWSSLIGLVVAAVTGDRPHTVSPAASAAFTIVGAKPKSALLRDLEGVI